MPNADLIRRTVKAMEENQERWDQSSWVDDWMADREREDPMCGTTLCFAGFAMLTVLGPDEFAGKAYERRGGRWEFTDWVLGDLHELDVPFLAKEARKNLGLDDADARSLFGAGTDDLDDFKHLVTDVTGVTFP